MLLQVSMDKNVWCYFVVVLFCVYVVGHRVVTLASIDSIWQTLYFVEELDDGNSVMQCR